MRKLILIKHAKPLIDPAKSSGCGSLSEEGREQARRLAEALAPHEPGIVYSSTEPKAMETAQIVAEVLNVPTESLLDLHEHDRSNVPHMRSGEFISNIELFFRRPDDRVLGKESASEALWRFEAAIEGIVAQRDEGNIAIVSHGTVIALFIEKHSDRNGFAVWREMSLPSFGVFELPEMELVELNVRV